MFLVFVPRSRNNSFATSILAHNSLTMLGDDAFAMYTELLFL